MNIAQLKKKIATLPDHMEVMIETGVEEREFSTTIVERAGTCLVPMREDLDGPIISKEKCFVLTAY